MLQHLEGCQDNPNNKTMKGKVKRMVYKYIRTITNEDYYAGSATNEQIWQTINEYGIDCMELVLATDGTEVIKLVSGYTKYLFGLDNDLEFISFYRFLYASGLYEGYDNENHFVTMSMYSTHRAWIALTVTTFMKLFKTHQLLQQNNVDWCTASSIRSDYLEGDYGLPKKYNKLPFKNELLNILKDDTLLSEVHPVGTVSEFRNLTISNLCLD